jgi:hypothetical protein
MSIPYLNTEISMTEERFRSLPAAAVAVLESARAQREWWRNRETGEFGVTIRMPSDAIAERLEAAK